MKGQKALFLPFRKHLSKYFFLLVIFSFMVVITSSKRSITDGMRYCNYYYIHSVIKGDGRVDCDINVSPSVIETMLKSAAEGAGGEITESRVCYPDIYSIIKGSDNNLFYLDIFPAPELKDNEVLLFSNMKKECLPQMIDPVTNETYEIKIITDDKKAQKMNLGINEAFVSEDLFWKICRGQGAEKGNYYGRIEFDFKGDMNFKLFTELIARQIKSQKTENLTVLSVYDNTAIEDPWQVLYRYDFTSSSVDQWNRENLLSEKYNSEMINEEARFNSPMSSVQIWMRMLWWFSFCILILTNISVFDSRKEEFHLYRELGMPMKKQTLMLFLEELILSLMLVLLSAAGIMLVRFLLLLITPSGSRIVRGEDVYFIDLMGMAGRYVFKNTWLNFLNDLFDPLVSFLFLSSGMNTWMLFLQKRRWDRT